jgi:hypothetical protein
MRSKKNQSASRKILAGQRDSYLIGRLSRLGLTDQGIQEVFTQLGRPVSPCQISYHIRLAAYGERAKARRGDTPEMRRLIHRVIESGALKLKRA